MDSFTRLRHRVKPAKKSFLYQNSVIGKISPIFFSIFFLLFKRTKMLIINSTVFTPVTHKNTTSSTNITSFLYFSSYGKACVYTGAPE